jgi:hypothetical protein
MARNFIETSPHQLSALCVVRASRAINETVSDPAQWFLAIADLHRALNSALVAALRGSAGIGAYSLKLRQQWLNYFEQSRTNEIGPPARDRVEPFLDLLSRAQQASVDLQGEPLSLSVQVRKDLEKLNSLRDDIEHVKPTAWSLEIVGLPRISRAAASALDHLYSLPPVYMHLSEVELAAARDAISQILEVKDFLE